MNTVTFIAPCLALLFFLAGVSFIQASDWLPAQRDSSENKLPDALEKALDVNPPAGKHGHLQIRNGQMVFENGKRARFWGVNICAEACFPDKKTAALTAARLASYGFNIVRFHNFDTDFEPRGIFKDPAPRQRQRDSKRTGIISRRQIDNLDFFIAQLKKHGIYVNLNLMSGRKFSEADGIRRAKELREFSNQAGKPASLFDPVLISLQKIYMNDLLHHVNPYTGMKYKDDPVICQLELANETALFRYWFNGSLDGPSIIHKKRFPKFYLNQLEGLWQHWLNRNGKHYHPRVSWRLRKLAPREHLSDTIRFYSHIEERYFLDMTDYLKNHIGTKALVTGSGHYFSLANLRAQSVADFTSPHYYWDSPQWPGKRWDKTNFTLHNKSIFDADTDRMKRKVNPIGDIAMSCVDNKAMVVTEWRQIFPNPYAYELPIAFAAYGCLQDWDGFIVYAYQRKSKNKTYGPTVDDFFEIDHNPQQLIAGLFGSLIFRRGMLKPSTTSRVTNINRQDIVKNVNGWGMLRRPNKNWGRHPWSAMETRICTRFADSAQPLAEPPKKTRKSPVRSDTGELSWHHRNRYFTIDAPSVQGAVGFVGNEEKISLTSATIQSDSNGSVLLVCLDDRPVPESTEMLVAAIGEVTNRNARWHHPIRWGSPPVMMKRMNTRLTIKTKAKKLSVTPLNAAGTPGIPFDIESRDNHCAIDFSRGFVWAHIQGK